MSHARKTKSLPSINKAKTFSLDSNELCTAGHGSDSTKRGSHRRRRTVSSSVSTMKSNKCVEGNGRSGAKTENLVSRFYEKKRAFEPDFPRPWTSEDHIKAKENLVSRHDEWKGTIETNFPRPSINEDHNKARVCSIYASDMEYDGENTEADERKLKEDDRHFAELTLWNKQGEKSDKEQTQHYKKQIARLKRKLQNQTNEKEKCLSDIQKIKLEKDLEQKDLLQKHRDAERERDLAKTSKDEVQRQLENSTNQLQNAKMGLSASIDRENDLRTQLYSSKEQLQNAQAESENSAHQLQHVQQELNSSTGQIQDLLKQLGLNTEQLQNVEAQLENLTNQLQHVQEERDATEDQLQREQEERDATEDQLQHVQEERDATENQLKHVQEERDATEDQLQRVQEERDATEDQLQHVQEERDATEDELQQAMAACEVQAARINELEDQFARHRLEMERFYTRRVFLVTRELQEYINHIHNRLLTWCFDKLVIALRQTNEARVARIRAELRTEEAIDAYNDERRQHLARTAADERTIGALQRRNYRSFQLLEIVLEERRAQIIRQAQRNSFLFIVFCFVLIFVAVMYSTLCA